MKNLGQFALGFAVVAVLFFGVLGLLRHRREAPIPAAAPVAAPRDTRGEAGRAQLAALANLRYEQFQKDCPESKWSCEQSVATSKARMEAFDKVRPDGTLGEKLQALGVPTELEIVRQDATFNLRPAVHDSINDARRRCGADLKHDDPHACDDLVRLLALTP